MKISAVNPYIKSYCYFSGQKNEPVKKRNKVECRYGITPRGINGERLVMGGNAGDYFILTRNLSTEKVGSKFIVESKLPEYKNLKMLITPESEIKSDTMYIGIKKKGERTPSFKGRLYGSIRQENGRIDYKMQEEYIRYWMEGMHSKITELYQDQNNGVKEDYNFFIPSDGDGTRYRDITTLQGGVTKPASIIPAELNGKKMSLVQSVITNFAKTGKLDKMFDLVRVEPAKGSAYAFLEALRTNQLSTKKPVVFSWGDNFFFLYVSRLMKTHEENNSAFTITTIPTDKSQTKSLSIVKIDSLKNGEIKEFTEKPQDDYYINSCIVDELGEDKCLSAVGPYIISPYVLEWIREKYIENPDYFLHADKGYDFSSMIIAKALKSLQAGEITDEEGNNLKMTLHIISDKETWSDLGTQKDFSKAMKAIKQGKYANLPYEMISTIKRNVDEDGNITFDNNARKLFDEMKKNLKLNTKNVISYYSE